MNLADRTIGFPGKYVQGSGALDRIGIVSAELGQSALVMADDFVKNLVGDRVEQSLRDANVTYHYERFGGECSSYEFNRLADKGRTKGCDLLIAIGGGKAIDAGKAAAAAMSVDIVAVPTIASTDGPASSIAVEYTEEHVHIGVLRFNRSPAAVVVDSQIIANAPARLLAAGMGDGLATWFEARACERNGTVINFKGGSISPVAMTLAKMCNDTILKYGEEAYLTVEKNDVNEAVERVIEANVFLSGAGFENTGVAAAHALDGAISRFCSDHESEHGERVALGILFQLLLEGADAERKSIEAFYTSVNLPRTLEDIGLINLDDNELHKLASFVLRDGSPIRNLPFEVELTSITSALKKLCRSV